MLVDQPGRRINRRQWFARSVMLGLVVGSGLSGLSCSQPSPSPAPTVPIAPTAGAPPPTSSSSAPKPAPTSAPTTPAKPAATQAPPKPRTLTKVKSNQADAGFELAYTMIGVSKGLHAEEGIDIEWLNMQDGVSQIKAQIAGESLLGMTGSGAVMSAIAEGADIKIIAAPRPRLNFVLYAAKDINRLEDLYGKPIGIGNLGAGLHQHVIDLFTKKKLDYSKLDFVVVGSAPNVYKAVVANKIAAGPSTMDFIPNAEKDGVKVLANLAEELPDYLRSILMTSNKTLADQPDLLERVTAGYAKSIRYGIEHGDEIVKLAAEQFGISEDGARFAHKAEMDYRILGPNLDFTPEQIAWTQQVSVLAGQQKAVLPFDRVATLDLQKRVIGRIGRYEWRS